MERNFGHWVLNRKSCRVIVNGRVFLIKRIIAKITLSACAEGDVVRVRVRDTGVGIPAADLPHVFDRFYKVDKSHHSKGTGLGLAIAYEIMKHLGEEMSVTSEPGQGSCFTFTLHIAQGAAELPKAPA